MKDRVIAIASIAFMLFAASAKLCDMPLIAYAIALIYAVVRWKLCESGQIQVKNLPVQWMLRSFIVICCVLFAAGGGHLSSVMDKSSPIAGGIFAFFGFAFAYDIGRFFLRRLNSNLSLFLKQKRFG